MAPTGLSHVKAFSYRPSLEYPEYAGDPQCSGNQQREGLRASRSEFPRYASGRAHRFTPMGGGCKIVQLSTCNQNSVFHDQPCILFGDDVSSGSRRYGGLLPLTSLVWHSAPRLEGGSAPGFIVWAN